MDLSSWIERRADLSPSKVAIGFEGREISYAELFERVRRTARFLKHAGIGRDDRVAYLALNRPEYLELVFACARLGAMVVPLNWRLARPEYLHILQHAQPRLIVAAGPFVPQLERFRERLPGCLLAALEDGGAGWLDYAGDLAGASGADRTAGVGYDAPLLLVYTSGTTGRPKGAVLTQSAVFWNAINSTIGHELTSADRVLTCLPMFHVGGLNIQTLPALHAGARVVLHARFDPQAALETIAGLRITLMVMVPAVMKAMSEHPLWETTDLGSLRQVSAGSQVVPAALIDAFQRRGVAVTQVYGATETAPIATVLPREDAFGKVGSCGKPALHCELKVVDDDGREVGPGERGEILVRGPNLMSEYWRDPEATAAALSGGWFHTGDVGHRDRQGFYYIDDRKTDVIISGGENIYPAEVEAVLAGHPAIAAAAVVARADARWGEVPVAVIVPKPGARLEPEEVMRLFDGRIARYKWPRDIVVIDSLPTSALGKVLKYKLRD
ncbi:MAG: acyl-CoA synthetase, partial [Pseudomonadota bacterium]